MDITRGNGITVRPNMEHLKHDEPTENQPFELEPPLWSGSAKIDNRNRGTPILTSLLEDLVYMVPSIFP